MSRSTLLSSIKSIFISTISLTAAKPDIFCFSCRLCALEETSTARLLDGRNSGDRQVVVAGEFYGVRMTQGLRDVQQRDRTAGNASPKGRRNHLAVKAEACELERYQARLWRICVSA